MGLFPIAQTIIILISTINTVTCLDNVAQGKIATQSGSYYGFSTADKAVDGNNNPDMFAESCAYPYTRSLSGEEYLQPAWWRVDLGTPYDVYHVIIVNRNTDQVLLSDTWVTVSDEENVTPNNDTICNEINVTRQDVVNVTCNYKDRNPPLRGRYVTIRRKDTDLERHVMNFCEVEVLSCRFGFWGVDCSQSCGRCVEETCRVSDGHCYSVCQDGYWGVRCYNQCSCQDCDIFTGCTTEATKRTTTAPTTPATSTTPTTPATSTTPATIAMTKRTITTTITTATIAANEPVTDTGEVNIGLVVGMVVLSIVLITGVVIIIILYKRKKKQQQNRNEVTMEMKRPEPEGLSDSRNTAVYDEIPEYEELKQDKEEKRYQKRDVVDKVYVSLKPIVMETLRDHIQSTNNEQSQQQPRYQNITLPETVYGEVYAGHQPNLVALKDVKDYINNIREQIEKFDEEYEEEAEVLYTALIDVLETADTSIPSSQFSIVYNGLQKINTGTLKSTLKEQYQILAMVKPLDERPLKSGLLPENNGKNRNRDIVPSDRFRAFLRRSNNENTDYINAVVIAGIKEGENYILTQSPMRETVADLWRLVYDYNSSTIVMLNQISTDQEENKAAVVYWPEVGTPMQFESMIISTNSYSLDSKNKSIHIRELELSIEDSDYESEQMNIKQFSLKEWNQSTLIRDFIRLIELIDKWQSKNPSQPETILIHCLNGAERSGLFCVTLYVAQQIKTQEKVDIFSAVKHVRLYRSQCISDEEQYIFLHEFAQEYIKQRN